MFGTVIRKFVQAPLVDSGHDRYNCIVYTDDIKNNFPSYSDVDF